ncbi:universal stress protein [Methanosarcina sp.]|jgi:nucleotide-binding universal stress UspA family protein|uniref:universal stress protein n=1 Tax=Methanosarcina sp. TaxID=2213 RepID=UPI002C5D8E39|nr:universal stress protein [Methanosarcina sp.]HOW15379.1 universal stress protein [Methanosarcina sp.]
MSSELYRNIVIATDGSENSRKAISCGIEIAKISGATVYIIHVVDTLSVVSDIWTAGKDLIHDMMIRDGKKILSETKKTIEDSGVEVKDVLLNGHPGEEIIKFAENNNMDLIVMGTLGATGLEKFLMGSVAEKVVRHSKVPVMVVRNQD